MRSIAAATVLTACQWAFPITRDDSIGDVDAAPSGDGGSTDAGGAATDAQDGFDSGLLPNGSFELGCVGRWYAYLGIVSDDRLARSGKASCRVCIAEGETSFYIAPSVVPADAVNGAKAGVRYRVEAYARAAPDAPSATNCRLNVTAFAGANPTTPDVVGSTVPVSGTSWIRLTTDIVPTDPTTDRLLPRISSERVPEGGCLLIDDVSVFVVP